MQRPKNVTDIKKFLGMVHFQFKFGKQTFLKLLKGSRHKIRMERCSGENFQRIKKEIDRGVSISIF